MRLGGLPGTTDVRVGGQTVRASPRQKAADAFKQVASGNLGGPILTGRTPAEKVENVSADLALPLQEQVQSLSDCLVELDEGITAMRHSGIYRPRWAVGMSNAELEA